MSENNNTTNTNSTFAEERDAQLWATARRSARLANTYGVKVTTVLARLAASRVLGGEDVSTLATMVADDADMRAAGVKASSIRAYGAPLRRLAAVLTPSVYEALLIGDRAVTVTTADKWTRDPDMTSAKVDRALGGLEVNRADIAAEMAKLIPSPDANKSDASKGDASKGEDKREDKREDKGDADKGDADKGDADKGEDKREDKGEDKREDKREDKGDADKGDASKGDASKGEDKREDKGDPMAAAHDALTVLTNMIKRGETTARGRRAMMKSLRVSIDELVNAARSADRADADRCIKA